MTPDSGAPERIVLIGLRCSGKTTVGRLLARALGWEFVDADEELVRRQGRSVAEIFATDGEPAFRAIEKEVLADLCGRRRLVLATGGGAVLDPENVRAMRGGGFVVHLDASPEVLWERMRRDPATGGQRPGLTCLDDGLAEMIAVAGKRAPLYEVARHVVIDAHALGPEAAARAVLRRLTESGSSRD